MTIQLTVVVGQIICSVLVGTDVVSRQFKLKRGASLSNFIRSKSEEIGIEKEGLVLSVCHTILFK